MNETPKMWSPYLGDSLADVRNINQSFQGSTSTLSVSNVVIGGSAKLQIDAIAMIASVPVYIIKEKHDAILIQKGTPAEYNAQEILKYWISWTLNDNYAGLFLGIPILFNDVSIVSHYLILQSGDSSTNKMAYVQFIDLDTVETIFAIDNDKATVQYSDESSTTKSDPLNHWILYIQFMKNRELMVDIIHPNNKIKLPSHKKIVTISHEQHNLLKRQQVLKLLNR